ncbi:MAG: hypothetical protein ACYSTY_12260 [Planctomycetota bacterium]|jgi:hypothetical protein
MRRSAHPIVLALALVLLVGGWEVVHFAEVQQVVQPQGNKRVRTWVQGTGATLFGLNLPAPRRMHFGGLVAMAVGAGILGFAVSEE